MIFLNWFIKSYILINILKFFIGSIEIVRGIDRMKYFIYICFNEILWIIRLLDEYKYDM